MEVYLAGLFAVLVGWVLFDLLRDAWLRSRKRRQRSEPDYDYWTEAEKLWPAAP